MTVMTDCVDRLRICGHFFVKILLSHRNAVTNNYLSPRIRKVDSQPHDLIWNRILSDHLGSFSFGVRL